MSRYGGTMAGLVVAAAFLATALSVRAASLEDGMRAYAARDFATAEQHFRAAESSGPDAARAKLMLGRTLVYLGRMGEAKQEVLAAREMGLPEESQAEADMTLRYIGESMAEAAAIPSKVLFEATGYLRGEFVDGLARDASLSSDLTPVRKSDWRARFGGGLGVEIPVMAGSSSVSLGLGIDELRYDTYRDFDEGNYRGSARLHHRLSDTWAASLEYDALRTFVGRHDPFSLTNRFGAGTTFRHAYFPSLGASLVAQVGADWVVIDYETAQDLDSEALSATLAEQLRFSPSAWVGLSFTSAQSSAELSRYSYRLNRLMLTGQSGLSHFGLGEWFDDVLVRGALSRTGLDFVGLDSVQTDRKRQDAINSISMGATKPITEIMSIVVDASFSHSNSNLTRYDYHSTLLSVGVRANF